MKTVIRVLTIVMLINTVQALSIDYCFNLASKQYQIPNKLLKAIAKVETRLDPLAIHKNSNQSYDMGIMQINSTWLPMLNKVGISEAELLDGCKNIQVGAWVLAQNIKRYGLTRQAIGAYHSPTPELQQKYAQIVMKNVE